MEPRHVDKLETAECWRLAEGADLGRLAVGRVDGAPDVFPVNHHIHEGSIYLRTGTGTKLHAITSAPEVAYEIDGEDAGFYWSVVIHGTARRLTAMDEIEASGILQLSSWSPTSRNIIIRITPTDVTGRRFAVPPGPPGTAQTSPVRPVDDTPTGADGAESSGHRRQKPKPIPHQPPTSEPQQ
jgi:nitroimidazol reductase NimA-like FMN-containing flavoprotein (pyridoxamine 5'-phosphate oxidase superfamily)